MILTESNTVLLTQDSTGLFGSQSATNVQRNVQRHRTKTISRLFWGRANSSTQANESLVDVAIF